jgi:O-antigen ligase
VINRFLPTFAPRLPATLTGLCAAYLAMLLTNNLVWVRSVTFALMAATALLLILNRRQEAAARAKAVGVPLLLVILWFLWSTAALRWTIEPKFSVREWETEVQYAALVFMSFFVGARGDQAVRTIVTAFLGSFAALSALAIALWLRGGGIDFTLWHHDQGFWSTHLVLVAPVLLALFARPPGTRVPRRNLLLFGVLLALLLVNARLTDNRMVWLALAASFGTAATVAALRWRSALRRARWRWMLPLVALFVVLGFALADTANEKAESRYPRNTTVAQTLQHDPRLALWEVMATKIRAEPWLGYGLGRGILRQTLPVELHDPLLTHPHNSFVSQWLQTGAIGLAIFTGMLAALAWRYVRYVRSRDDILALMGVIGLALMAGFVVKNLTDDFFYRSNAKVFWALTAVLLAYGAWRNERPEAGG